MKYLVVALLSVVLFTGYLHAQDGSGANPFVNIGQARNVTSAGLYSFSVEGSSFTTYVDADGYIQVAVDFGDGVGALPQTGYLAGTTRSILDPGSLAKFSGANEVRMTSSVGNLDARSTNAVLIGRVASNTSLMSGSADNAHNDDWTGVGSANLRVNSTTARATSTLNVEIHHPFGDGTGLHWYPERGDQALTFGNDIAASEKFTLWMRAELTPLRTPAGTVDDPFTDLVQAYSVTEPSMRYFRLRGVTFSTLVDLNGYVQVALDYGYGGAALPQLFDLTPGSPGILMPVALSTLTDAAQIKLTSSVPGTLEATTTNAELLLRIVYNQTLKNRPADNQFSTDWVGTGSEFLRVAATVDKAPNQLDNEIFHTNGDSSGMHWFPSRGDQGLQYLQDIPDGDKFTLWVRAAPAVTCTITLPTPTATAPACPGGNDGSLVAAASCDGCTELLEYSLDGSVYQTSGQFANLSAGSYQLSVRQAGGAGCSQSRTVVVPPGTDNTLPALPALGPLTLTACSGAQTVPAPTVQDNCAGTVTATTSDATTFSASGDYTIRWTFNDGNGNTAAKTQRVKVYGPVQILPFTEGVETGSPTLACWKARNVNGGNGWTTLDQQNVAHGGNRFFILYVDATNGNNDQLLSPAFTAAAGAWYELKYAYRTYGTGPAGLLSAVLVNTATNTAVKQLSIDTDASNVYREINLLFDVPQTGTYRIEYHATAAAGGRGILLDDMSLDLDTGPLGGPAGLVGNGDDACTTLQGYGLSGNAYARFVDGAGRLAVEIDPNGNDLGDMTVEMTDYAAPPLSPAINTRFLSRHFNISPTNGSGPYTVGGGVKVRLYYTAQELLQLSNVVNEDLMWEDITILHYSGANQDCSIENSNGFQVDFEQVTSVLPFAAGVFALEFTTTGFSEFGGTSNSASQGFPVVLRSFNATEWGSGNRLDWVVDSEIDFSHYSVQRSDDGLTFTDLTRVKGARLASYSTTDPAPAALQYYRLKMVDYDGSFAYSSIMSVERDYRQKQLSVYPVPTAGEVTIRFAETEAGRVRLRLIDGLGRTVLRDVYRAEAGTNERVIDLSDLPPGFYTLLLSDGEQPRSIKVYRNQVI